MIVVVGSPVAVVDGASFDAAGLAALTAIELAAKGASVDVTFMPTRMGTYAFRCSHFLHATFGMTGNAVVE